MLKGIDPLLNPEVLYVLQAMGHGDLLVLVDSNFPADAIARETVHGSALRIDCDLPRAARAILSLLPLDTFVPDFAGRMEVVGAPQQIPPVQAAVQAEIDAAEGRPRAMSGIERFAFYDTARGAYAVIQTGEHRLYGCITLRKGVIGPEG